MTAFSQVPTSMYDGSFVQLSPDAQRLEWFIRTSPERATEGLFRLKFGSVEDSIGMDRVAATDAMRELTTARPFMYDWTAGVVLDRHALRDTPLGKRNPDDSFDVERRRDHRIKGAVRKLLSLPKTPLLRDLFLIASVYSPEFAEAMREALPEVEHATNEAPLEGPTQEASTAPLTTKPETPSDLHKQAPSEGPYQGPYQGARREEAMRGEVRTGRDVVKLLHRELGAKVIGEQT